MRPRREGDVSRKRRLLQGPRKEWYAAWRTARMARRFMNTPVPSALAVALAMGLL